MKKVNFLTIVTLFVLFSCNSGEKTNVQKMIFGIYETVKVKEIPNSIIDKLKMTKIQIENDTQLPIIGYVQINDSINLQTGSLKENLKLVKTVYTIDKEDKYYAIVAIKQNPIIKNSDIKKTKNMGKNVEIHFTMTGARKWADMIKNNQGKMVAFTIDDQLYSLPYIHGEINNGCALITGIKNETSAKKISESLNSSKSE